MNALLKELLLTLFPKFNEEIHFRKMIVYSSGNTLRFPEASVHYYPDANKPTHVVVATPHAIHVIDYHEAIDSIYPDIS